MADRATKRDAYRLLNEKMEAYIGNATKLSMIEPLKKALSSALKAEESPWEPVLDQRTTLLGPKSQEAYDALASVWRTKDENFPDPL